MNATGLALRVEHQCDGCVARAVYTVRRPTEDGELELVLCEHHYRRYATTVPGFSDWYTYRL